MGEAPRYEIASLADFDKVPDERLGACLQEFATWLALRRFMDKTGIAKTKDRFTWIDDGKQNVYPRHVSE